MTGFRSNVRFWPVAAGQRDRRSSIAIASDTLAVGAAQEDGLFAGVDGNQADNSETSVGASYVFQ